MLTTLVLLVGGQSLDRTPQPLPVVDLRGEVDGDGCNDILQAGVQLEDRAWVVYAAIESGRTGATLHCIRAGVLRFPDPVPPVARFLGDLNDDGASDYGVLWPAIFERTNRLQIRSGRDGSLLTEIERLPRHEFAAAGFASQRGLLLPGVRADGRDCLDAVVLAGPERRHLRSIPCIPGERLASLSDLDGDGWDELLVGNPSGDPSGWAGDEPSVLRVLSGRDGRSLVSLEGAHCEANRQDRLGAQLEACGDFDGDGKDDFLAVAPGGDESWTEPGYVRVFSGADGRTLLTYGSPDRCSAQSFLATPAGDVDRDGRSDVLVARCRREGDLPAEVRCLTAGTSRNLPALVGSDLVHDWVNQLAGGGDCDGDEVPDFALCARIVCEADGHLELRSGRDGRFLRPIRVPELPRRIGQPGAK